MKKTNKIMLKVLLAFTVVCLFCEAVNQWCGQGYWTEIVCNLFLAAYIIGLFAALLGLPLSILGLWFSRGDRRATLISGLNCLASLVFLGLFLIVPIVKGDIIIGRGISFLDMPQFN